ncbi:M50 family metallopeptidase [Spirochaetota bacterium]
MKSKSKIDIKILISLLVICLLIILFWNTIVVYPIKIFVVLLHEISHGIAAVITGGSIVKIEISSNQGGVCYTLGGLRFIILSAGYLGSMFWGGLILVMASRSKFDKYISIIIGVIILIITAVFIRNAFGLIYGIVFSLVMVALGWFVNMEVNDFILKVIGLTSILYAIIDIKDDLLTRQIPSSDASMLGKFYFGSSTFWGILWVIIALLMAFLFLRISSKNRIEY